ncbi:hypothetical protein ACFQO1_06415 [Jejudonia soesokkakensis]|uniref:Uncharacterized protein n=1 Tax=Jejudonia soesokkakensis TaxID=1323432 RepID=A0ABW2MUH2_9FLAO
MKIFKNVFFIIALSFLVSSCLDDNSVSTDDTINATIIANLYISNNTNGNVTSYDFTNGAGIFARTLVTQSNDAEGIFYDAAQDQLTQVSRTDGTINSYNNISQANNGDAITPDFSSASVLESPRDIAVNGNFVVVSDNADFDNDPMTEGGRFFIFNKSGSTYTLRNTITVDFAVWGIDFIGDDLFVVVDKTGDIASFSNFIGNNTTDAVVAPTKRITLGGITRTHGIVYDGTTLVATDIGDADSNTDGGFHVISDFLTKYNSTNSGETLAISSQVRVSGTFTRLGNPVSVAYDSDSGTVFIAERANNGGRVLLFDNIGTGGNLSASFSGNLPGASSLHFENVN